MRVRIAPSPTGAMHLGLARTALYNWLFARHHGGKLVLRIDDTDQERNVAEALEPILRGMRWLGIDWDEGPEVGGPHEPYFQSQRAERYQEVVEELVKRGAAYRDYARPEETRAEWEQAVAAKRPTRYSRRWMADTEEKRAQFEAEGRTAAVRLKMPADGKLVLRDLVRRTVEFEWGLEQDHVVRRADGSCLYHLASIVDDHDFGITHVIRGEEHLSNTPRQVFIAQSLGWGLPEFAHLPYVAEPGSRSKLSKRRTEQYLKSRDFAELMERGMRVAQVLGLARDRLNPVAIEFYERVGFLPQAVVNYLALLGWALDDSTEHLSRDLLVQEFSLDRVNRAPASFDPGKLMSFQVRHVLALPVADRARFVLPFLEQAGFVSSDVGMDVMRKVERIVDAAGDRIKVAADILDYDYFFVPDDELRYDEEALGKRVARPGAAELLARFRDRLAAVEDSSASGLEKLTGEFVADEGVELGDVIHALRVAVTGRSVGFGMFETMAILGTASCQARIDRTLSLTEQDR